MSREPTARFRYVGKDHRVDEPAGIAFLVSELQPHRNRAHVPDDGAGVAMQPDERRPAEPARRFDEHPSPPRRNQVGIALRKRGCLEREDLRLGCGVVAGDLLLRDKLLQHGDRVRSSAGPLRGTRPTGIPVRLDGSASRNPSCEHLSLDISSGRRSMSLAASERTSGWSKTSALHEMPTRFFRRPTRSAIISESMPIS